MIKVCIIDYGSGNQRSLFNLIKSLNFDVILSNSEKEISKCSHLLLPGVGSYGDLMQRLKEKNLIDILSKEVLIKEKFFLGICVGMQVLSTIGYEFKKILGLNWIKGEVRKINTSKLKLPHIGWNNIKILKSNIIDNSINNLDFYFLHSYIFLTNDSNNTIATTIYGEEFASIISYKNIWGFQFHPEKSQSAGKKILLDFFGK